MNFIQAILMGIVQGLSEFLPVSSSAHLVFTSNFYKVFKNIPIVAQSNEEVFFDIMLHLGTLIAVLIFFRKDVWEIAKALFLACKNRDFSDHKAKLGIYIIVGTIITIALALPFNGVAEHLVYHPALVGGLLIITGGVLFLSEYLSKKREGSTQKVSLKQALLIGLAQGVAVLPGFSRSGWTMATGLFAGLDRATSARYSFLLSIPIILGASMVYPFVKINVAEAVTYNYFGWNSCIWYCGLLVYKIFYEIYLKIFIKYIWLLLFNNGRFHNDIFQYF